jgi:prevent-host-death family protein
VISFEVTEARAHFSDVVRRSAVDDVTLFRRGRPAAVLMSPYRNARLVGAAEDAADVAAFDESMSGSDPNIPWDVVKSELGWE